MTAFVHLADNSTASGTVPLAAGSCTITAGDTVVVAVLTQNTTSGNITGITDGLGNSYTPIGSVVDASPNLALFTYYCQNASGGTANITVNGAGSVNNGIWADRCPGLATSGGPLSSNKALQSGPGTGANILSSGSVTIATSAMLWGFTANMNAANPPTGAGTGFTSVTTGWTAFGAGTATAQSEYEALSTSAAATFGITSGTGQYDDWLTYGVAFAVAAAGGTVIAWIT